MLTLGYLTAQVEALMQHAPPAEEENMLAWASGQNLSDVSTQVFLTFTITTVIL